MNAKELLKNKWVVIALVVISLILVLWVYRNRKRWWQQLTRVDNGDYTAPKPEPGSARENELKQLARDLFTAMDGATLSDTLQNLLNRAYALSDTELRIVAEAFTGINGDGDSLAAWIDDEAFAPWVDIDTKVISRLNNMGLQ